MVRAESWTALRLGLLRITRRYCPTHADAEDIVQAVLERLLRRGGELGLPETPPSAGYLRQMCLNTVRSAHRSRVRRSQRESEWGELAEAVDSPEIGLLERGSTAQLLAALATVAADLPGYVVRAFVLCDVEGVSAPRAAQLLGVPEGTVRTWLRRFRTRLAAVLRAEEALPT